MLFITIPLVTVFFDQPVFELDYFWWRVAGVVAIVLGAGILISSWIEFRKHNLKILGLPDGLVTSGPYRFVRHPQYLGLIFIFVGWWWVWGRAYSFYFGMLILAMIWIQGYLEEKFILEKKFGEKFRKYRAQTGMFWIK
ncbi:MAG: methyltransferase family protein [Candidatus Margulisiibacteriota bacterium]